MYAEPPQPLVGPPRGTNLLVQGFRLIGVERWGPAGTLRHLQQLRKRSMKRLFGLAALLPVLALHAQNPVQLKLNHWASTFTKPVDITHCGDSRLFVVRQAGVIRIITDSNTVLTTPFLDIQNVVNDTYNEQGLLGLAFDPDYGNNGHFYVHYTGGTGVGYSVISRFTVSADSNIADPGSEVVLYTWPQPFENHNGGDLAFGPDGHLYITLGDGGSGGDPQGNAQDPTDPLGNILRIHPEPDSTYSIPADNPWANAGGDTLPEIWASGLRNPFRFGFDRQTGDIWIGDVGQNAWEEIDFWPANDFSAANFGWRCYEGDVTYNNSGCQPQSYYTAPVTVHANVGIGGGWCSSIGGRVYRGTEFPRLVGRYIYTDYCAGEFWSLTPDGLGGWNDENLLSSGTQGYVCIGEGFDGSLYVCNQFNGQIKKIVDKCPMDPPVLTNDGYALSSTAANGYQWYLNGTLIGGATQQSFIPQVGGDYYVVGAFSGGCSLISDTVTFIATGINEVIASELVMFPQPADRQVVLQRSAALEGPLQVRVMDATGREVSLVRWAAGVDQLTLSTGQLATGSYGVLLEDEGGVLRHREVLVVVH